MESGAEDRNCVGMHTRNLSDPTACTTVMRSYLRAGHLELRAGLCLVIISFTCAKACPITNCEYVGQNSPTSYLAVKARL
jgi:hypothetical protein